MDTRGGALTGMTVFEHLLRAATPAAGFASVDAWLAHLARAPLGSSIDRALWAGFEADRLGYAFVGGYDAALGALLDRAGALRDPAARRSLAVTERGGAHPRAIEATLTGGEGSPLTVSGEKTFATLAPVADELLVVASRGVGDDGRNRLCVVRVPRGAAGVSVQPLPDTPFAPEIPHGRVVLDGVAVRAEDVLAGDGYASYVKPFRTIEDTHVLASALAYGIRAARAYGFPRELIEGALPLVVALQDVAASDPADPTAHVLLAGAFRAARSLFAEHDAAWEGADPAARDRWRRDGPLFSVAEGARRKRTEAAWAALAGP